MNKKIPWRCRQGWHPRDRATIERSRYHRFIAADGATIESSRVVRTCGHCGSTVIIEHYARDLKQTISPETDSAAA